MEKKESKAEWMRRKVGEVPHVRQRSNGWNIPRDKSYSEDAIQCDGCGGFGCENCHNSGWVAPNSPHARRCYKDDCNNPIPPYQIAVYCTNECAWADA